MANTWTRSASAPITELKSPKKRVSRSALPAKRTLGSRLELELRPLRDHRDQGDEQRDAPQVGVRRISRSVSLKGTVGRGARPGSRAVGRATRGSRSTAAAAMMRGEHEQQVHGPERPTSRRASSPPTIAPNDAPLPTRPKRRRACRVSNTALANDQACTGRDDAVTVHPDVERGRNPAAGCKRSPHQNTRTFAHRKSRLPVITLRWPTRAAMAV